MLLSCWLFGIFFGPAVLSQSTCIPTLYLPGNPAAAAIAFVTFFSSFSTSSMSTSEPVLPALVRHSCLAARGRTTQNARARTEMCGNEKYALSGGQPSE
jgi:molybdopterin biosynthesis enzyme